MQCKVEQQTRYNKNKHLCLGYIDEPFVIPPQPIGQHRVTDEIAEDKASFQMLPQPSNLEHGDVAILGLKYYQEQ